MRIHSNVLTSENFYRAARDLPGVFVEVTEHGSRSHARAYEFSLTGNGYRRNTGNYGAGEEIGATWDEWGAVLAYLFAQDENALAGSVKYPVYRGQAHFDLVTGGRFFPGVLPADAHKRHVWVYSGYDRAHECKKCSATWNRGV